MKYVLIVALFCAGAQALAAQNSPDCYWERPDTPEGRTKGAIDELIVLTNAQKGFSQGVLDVGFAKGDTREDKIATAKLLLRGLRMRKVDLKTTFFYFRANSSQDSIRAWTISDKETPEEHGIDRTRLIRADTLSAKLSDFFQ